MSRTISDDQFDRLIEHSIYMESIMRELGTTTAPETLEAVKAAKLAVAGQYITEG